jgi:twitching motility two-component system response regulator PilH
LARRILLADDSVTAQNMGRRILTDAGYELVTVNNGSAALKKIAETKPDIVVLDVYMPGYGGLEVCQRIKESPETARIPVLLTVGKLEPFKPDEARRVGADAFIIKPFEATELLTALTKLEDKIVAAPQPQKSGRFARALAAVEAADFGDKETGWKNRLTIPGPLKPKWGEKEASEIAAGPGRDFDRSEAAKPVEAKQEFERPIPAGLPADITPEEIAAITAAAASFDGKAAHPTVIAEGSASVSAPSMQAASAEIAAVHASEQEAPAATLASSTESEERAPAEVAAESAPAAGLVPEAVASGEPAQPEESPAATELPTVAAEADSATQAAAETRIPDTEKPSGSDAEVMAAIASLAPSNGRGESVHAASGVSGSGQEAAVPVASVVAAEAGTTGPRWVAEAVAVTAEESALALHQEMEQALAARGTAAAIQDDTTATATAVELPTPAPVVEAAEPAIAASASVTQAGAATESVPAPSSVVAESVSAEASTAQSTPEALEPAVAKGESAYAAAAAAGSVSEHLSTVDAVSATTTSSEITASAASASSGEVTPQREAELAAAWQNWKQIRESFANAPPTKPVEEAPVAASVPQEEAPAPAKAEEAEVEPVEVEAAASEPPGESTAIASIVDTMLAELRPKLVEEIAKKMNSEKKEREREKDKKKKR